MNRFWFRSLLILSKCLLCPCAHPSVCSVLSVCVSVYLSLWNFPVISSFEQINLSQKKNAIYFSHFIPPPPISAPFSLNLRRWCLHSYILCTSRSSISKTTFTMYFIELHLGCWMYRVNWSNIICRIYNYKPLLY